MEYYIEINDSNRTEWVRQSFEILGYDTSEWELNSGVYFTLEGRIDNTFVGSTIHKLVLMNKENYTKLPKLIKPIFNIGDVIKYVPSNLPEGCITQIKDVDVKKQRYLGERGGYIYFRDQNDWEIYKKSMHDVGDIVKWSGMIGRIDAIHYIDGDYYYDIGGHSLVDEATIQPIDKSRANIINSLL